MSGFTGSERAGGRRRRILAVEVEGSESTEPDALGSGDSSERFLAATGKEAVGLSPRDCPIISVISVQAWKHWVLAALGVLVGIGVLIAGHTQHQWAVNLGPGIPRLLKIASSPVLPWANSLVMFLCAQAACVILWARSRSLRDFDGRYRIWGWAAATWILLSFSIATQAHHAWSETVLHHFPWRAQGAAMWCWLIPATIWGLGLALRLEQDMREDRLGHSVFLLAGVWHLVSVGLLCQNEFLPLKMSANLNQLLLAASHLIGAITLLLSMSLHARHVLYFSAEPPQIRRRGNKTTVAVPAPNRLFQRLLPSWMTGVKMPTAGGDDEGDDETSKLGRKRAAPKKKSTARKTTRRSKSSETEADEQTLEGDPLPAVVGNDAPSSGSSGKKNYRIDKTG